MILKLFWTARAQLHLQEIYEYIAADRPGSAHMQVERILETAERLSRFPASGRVGASPVLARRS